MDTPVSSGKSYDGRGKCTSMLYGPEKNVEEQELKS